MISIDLLVSARTEQDLLIEMVRMCIAEAGYDPRSIQQIPSGDVRLREGFTFTCLDPRGPTRGVLEGAGAGRHRRAEVLPVHLGGLPPPSPTRVLSGQRAPRARLRRGGVARPRPRRRPRIRRRSGRFSSGPAMTGDGKDGAGMDIETWLGDITELEVDAIVNAANEQLAEGGGVCGAIHDAAGPELADECARVGPCPTGDARATGGYELPARWVIHAVGPVWQGGDHDEVALLASAYRRSVEVADELGASSIAFPSISTGIYGFPQALAARTAVAALRAIEPVSVQRCVLVAFDEDTLDLLDEVLAGA